MFRCQELWREDGTRARTVSLERITSGCQCRRIGLIINGSGADTECVVDGMLIVSGFERMRNSTTVEEN
jgi:hypothetical protein